MIYALWEILIPLLIAFLLGVLLGWFIWRWRRTKVTSSEWSSLQERAARGGSGDSGRGSTTTAGLVGGAAGGAGAGNAANDERIVALTADLEVRDMEIEQLRRSHAGAKARIAELESTEPSAAAQGGGDNPSGWTIKGNVDSMKYHRPDSRSYAATVAEAWFETPQMAEAAGFTLAGSHPKSPSGDTQTVAGFAGGLDDGPDVVGQRHPFGEGSHGPLSDNSQPDGYVVKGNVDSMLYHRADSRNWGATIAEVWFDSPQRAEAAGFSLSPTHPKG